ncbi:WbqC family protein [Janthinobacterium sp. PSPC3-1]|uniref:WbqC family protein n=1 Tax=Janthinobacterium sp. PSPC3-1 TaxID=2804653 RepID=UPI003CF403DE
MKLAIMQPYFFPYIGYFQLLAAVDVFVLYDNIQYTKKGWINRNRVLLNGHDSVFSLPLKKDRDGLDVRERELAADFKPQKLLAQLRGAYQKAPHFEQTMLLVETILLRDRKNLFSFLHHSLACIAAHLGIATQIRISSEIAIDHALTSQDKVLALCKELGASTYVNAAGGQALYSKTAFQEQGIVLRFLQARPFEYQQFGQPCVPWLSIIDVLMFNAVPVVRSAIAHNYDLV